MPGQRCAVAVCKNYRKKSTPDGKNVSFFVFPKDPELRRKWMKKCRSGKWDAGHSRVCSDHFTEEDFERDLKNELLGLPVRRMLKSGSIPSLYLNEDETPCDKPEKDAGMTVKKRKELIEEILKNSKFGFQPKIQTQNNVKKKFVKSVSARPSVKFSESADLEMSDVTDFGLDIQAYKDEISFLRKEKLDLVEENKKLNNIILINKHQRKASIRLIKSFQKEIKKLKLQLEKVEKDGDLRQQISSCLSDNQINILLKKRTKVHWTEEEYLRAYAIRHLSQRCYFYLKDVCNYPLPGLSTLQKWAGEYNLDKESPVMSMEELKEKTKNKKEAKKATTDKETASFYKIELTEESSDSYIEPVQVIELDVDQEVTDHTTHIKTDGIEILEDIKQSPEESECETHDDSNHFPFEYMTEHSYVQFTPSNKKTWLT